jgi:hypothetical protein
MNDAPVAKHQWRLSADDPVCEVCFKTPAMCNSQTEPKVCEGSPRETILFNGEEVTITPVAKSNYREFALVTVDKSLAVKHLERRIKLLKERATELEFELIELLNKDE